MTQKPDKNVASEARDSVLERILEQDGMYVVLIHRGTPVKAFRTGKENLVDSKNDGN